MPINKTTRALTALIAGGVLALAAPLAASAHVSVSPDQAEPGSYSLLTFRVPNESETAGTIALSVALPTDTPFASVSVEPVDGWTATVNRGALPEPVDQNGTEITEAATSITWQADEGTQIDPGEFQRFAISVGPVPETGSIALPATQTYSDGEVVEWADDADGEYPAPVLYVTDAPAADHHGGAADGDDAAADADDDSATVTASSTSSDDGVARGLGIAALVVAALALVFAGYSAFGRRKA
ncbi:YcnI family protein [Amnibacterium flavum]|uniref:YncI copper-binding domain-containing protein n=1 Tax=Amnibacterium flavum TaxID=2173173 RepID=A0A2V1HV36_9MICO|nr:YcnI family protein [Amnibacterium flavum]PVZ96171.1 hypothetical protein DDQ50_07015 [Amnibacterium flavum]